MAYILGQIVRLTAVFRDDLQNLVDPTNVYLRIEILESPSSTRDAVPTHDSTGRYHFDLQTEKIGTYRHHWEGHSIDLDAVAEDTFRITRED